MVLSSGLIGMWSLYRTADYERQRADANFRDAQSAVDDFLTRTSQGLLDVPGLESLRRFAIAIGARLLSEIYRPARS